MPRSLAALATAAFAAFLLVYLFAVQTEIGRELDESAFEGGRAAPESAEDAADRLLRLVSLGSLIGATAVLSALAWLRRRPGLILVPVAVVGLSLLATELFKHVILPRPDNIAGASIFDNSYPSGHTTIAVALGMAALLISPPRVRVRVAFAAAALAAAGGLFVVTAEWHRPSDPIGSYLLTLAVTAGWLAWWRRGRRAEPETGSEKIREGAAKLEIAALLAGLGLFVGSGLIASLRYGAEVDWNRFNLGYLLAAATIVIVAGLSVAALLRALSSRIR